MLISFLSIAVDSAIRRISCHPDSVHSCSIIDGSISTTLAEDVFTLVHAQLALLDEYLVSSDLSMTDTGDAVFADALLSILRIIFCKQMHYGRTSLFLRDIETCIARANDYWKMGEKVDAMMQRISEKHYHRLTLKHDKTDSTLAEWGFASDLVRQEASKLMDKMNSDAVEASNRVAIFIIRAIEQLDIPRELFSRHWEEDLTSNEVAKYIVRVYTNFLTDMKDVLVSDCLYHKVLITLARCTICFYLKCFIFKASRTRSSNFWYDNRKDRKDFFRSQRKAFLRMKYDIEVFEDFFFALSEGSAALTKIISNEFSEFRLLFLECGSFAVGDSSPDFLKDFIIVVHKRTGADSNITRHFLSDVFILLGEKERNYFVRDSIQNMKEDLDKIKESLGKENDKGLLPGGKGSESSFFQLDEMLKAVYSERILQENAVYCGIVRKC